MSFFSVEALMVLVFLAGMLSGAIATDLVRMWKRSRDKDAETVTPNLSKPHRDYLRWEADELRKRQQRESEEVGDS